MDGPFTRATGQPSTVVSTSAGLQALVHPLRLQLLTLLRRHGPSTASRLGRDVGESSGSTSYHLRQLARFGMVELDPEQPNRRDKLWRALSDNLDVDVEALADDPAALAALDRLTQLQVQRFGRHLAAATRLPPDDLELWGRAMASSDATLRLTPDMLVGLRDDLLRVVAGWSERSDALPAGTPDARPVSLYLGAVPQSGDGLDW